MCEYSSIDDYAIIGDCRTLALISNKGAIDWLCLPYFSSPSIFAAILDQKKGGRFIIRPSKDYQSSRRYLDHSNILETVFSSEQGDARLIDLMPVGSNSDATDSLQPQREILRIIECTKGNIEVDILFEPRPDFAQALPRIKHFGKLGWRCAHKDTVMLLRSDVPLNLEDNFLKARIRLRQGDKRYFSLTFSKNDIGIVPPLGKDASLCFQSTLDWWQQWSKQCRYNGPYYDAVMRSALTLKLLTSSLTGAVLAAGTTSLPEYIGGSRNWDYRYCWLRDSAFVLTCFHDLGFTDEGESFFGWLLHATRLTLPKLQVLYDIFGETRLKEKELHHFAGHRQSQPVRIGNRAIEQTQLDPYGEIILAAHNFIERGKQIDRYEAQMLGKLGTTVCKEWRKPDYSIWEIRGKPRHYTFSKLMCWVALDRLLQLHEKDSRITIPVEKFQQEREVIRREIDGHGFNHNINSYVGFFDGTEPDASLLLMSRYGYLDPADPRMIGTYDYIQQHLGRGALLYRYPIKNYDRIAEPENTFSACSFWAVDYLVSLGRIEEAENRFEQLLSYGNDLGLFAEEIDATTAETTGNTPQAFTHAALITAALSLNEAQKNI